MLKHAEALEQLLDLVRYRRAWLRYLIHSHIADGAQRGFFFSTIHTTAGSVVPTWDPGKTNWLESGPFPGQFPGDYQDRLLASVRWRVMGLRTVRADKYRSRKGGGKVLLQQAATDGRTVNTNFIVRVWEEDWPRTMMPGRSRLARVGLTTPAEMEDYLRLFSVINGLDELHRRLLANAQAIRKTFSACAGELEDELRGYGQPPPPF